MAINANSAQILATSAAKEINKAKNTGKINMMPIALYNLIAYYAWYTKGLSEFNREHNFLLQKLTEVKYNYPDIICNYKAVLPITINPSTPTTNTAPTVDNNIKDLLGADLYQFLVSDFTLNYSDAEVQPWKFLTINPSAGVDGDLSITSGGTHITAPITINIEGKLSTDTINLFYNRTDLEIFGPDDFTFRVSDNPADYLFSALQTFSVSATVISGTTNLPATIGDNTIYVDNRVETIITLAMLTTGLTPPYNDPEADLIDAIRIDEISTANIGKFYINTVEIQVNDIITREDLIANLLTHDGPNQDAINSDVFNFSARDEGSQIWVQ